MGREVRRVPSTWEHPKDDRGRYVPLYPGAWLRPENQDPDYPEERDPNDYMPDWPDEECTHIMMYEDTSEGTPISPAFATPAALARWLADTGASAFADQTASYEAWLRVARGGFAPSAVMTVPCGPMINGVEALKGEDS